MPTISTIQHALATGQATASSLVDASFEAIQRDTHVDPSTYVSVDRESSHAAAMTSDALRLRDYVPSSLAGVPVSIKDLFDVKGEVTAAGSRVLQGAEPATRDSVAVSRLRDAGAVFVGRTNMSEFAYSGLGLNPHHGTPRNPHDARRVAGGSSSGAAVSVARLHVAWALGTDTGGSLRIPAAFCGLTAFKPTARRVPLDGVLPLASAFDSVGAIANSVDCCAAADAILSAETPDTTARPLDMLRLCVTYADVVDDAEDAVRAAFERALDELRTAGATIESIDFPELRDVLEHAPQPGITASQAWAWHRHLVTREGHRYDPRVLARLRRGERFLAADYIDLMAARERFIRGARRRLAPFDAWLMPTVAIVAPFLEALEHDDEHFFAVNAKTLRNPGIVNLLDGCALTLPCHREGELPVGMSIVGPAFADAAVLAIGRGVEARFRQMRSNA
ncbi:MULTISPECIES: amidase [unclassified Caballeronia]|uniref:amidase n=1 Tax=unclassified Caballeronia TaxID=2646786 RepID=UPI0028579FAA|nr:MULTISPECIES: amidase [unclassified Caballeronia]MDR5773292.1 amidase [Caballeronia sp. LZ002]MDR5848726.1 amidase [Caballeronia sp. LZ003]